ncbi:MAG: phosphatase PAP2 family protein [Ilumatobacter sp.]|nr:phosphatase PAP2 family protein [Ilumatobacter sp.]
MGTAVTTGAREGDRRLVASWWRSRYGAKLLVEMAICGGLLIIYRAIRTVNRTDLGAAFSNARDIVRLEEWLGLPFEDNLQRFLLDHPTLIKLLNHYYIWFHFPAAIGLLLWLYLRHPGRYRPFRNLMAFATFTGLIIHLLFPLAPPRMMDGFVDTMARFGPSIYPENALDGAANQIAAMPSLHFAWALIEAIAVISVLSSRWRWAIVVHPALMTLSIIATANHWWIDAAAAAMLVIGGIASYRVLRAWVGDRTWSWTAMRFQADDGIRRLESLANTNARADAEADVDDECLDAAGC